MSKSEIAALLRSAGTIAEAPIWIDDTPGPTIGEFQSAAVELKNLHNINYLVVDFVQQMRASQPGKRNRESEVAGICAGIKRTAQVLNIPVELEEPSQD